MTARPEAPDLRWQGIASAPRDGALVELRNAAVSPNRLFYWKAGAWHTLLHGIGGSCPAIWDPEALPPTEWRPHAPLHAGPAPV